MRKRLLALMISLACCISMAGCSGYAVGGAADVPPAAAAKASEPESKPAPSSTRNRKTLKSKLEFEPFEMEPEQWLALLRANTGKQRTLLLWKQYGIPVEKSFAVANEDDEQFTTSYMEIERLGSREAPGGTVEECMLGPSHHAFVYIFTRKPGEAWTLTDYTPAAAWHIFECQYEKHNVGNYEAGFLVFRSACSWGSGLLDMCATIYSLDAKREVLEFLQEGHERDFGNGYERTCKSAFQTDDDVLRLTVAYTYEELVGDYSDEKGDWYSIPVIEFLQRTTFVWDTEKAQFNFEGGGHLFWALPGEKAGGRQGLSASEIVREFPGQLEKAGRSRNKFVREWAKSVVEDAAKAAWKAT